VAVFACEAGVRALQREFGHAVIETARREIDDIGIAALMLDVAGAALSLAGVSPSGRDSRCAR